MVGYLWLVCEREGEFSLSVVLVMFKVFIEVAGELPSYTHKPVKAAYSASYSVDPVAAALGVKTPPALLLFRPGVEEAASMPIPRKKDEFNEDALVDWLKGHLK